MRQCTQEEMVAATASAYRNLFKFRKDFEGRTFTSKDQAATEICLNWDPSFLPNFHHEDRQLICRQKEFLGSLAFGEALSEFLVGVECMGAYEILEGKDYDPLASFAGYTSSFHLVDSFLSLHGIFSVPFPIQELQWKTFRRTRDIRVRGGWIERLEAKRLRSIGSEPISYVLATLNPLVNSWELSVIAHQSAHKLKWATYGDVLIQLIRKEGIGCIPREIADFFGYFAPHLAYLDETKDNERKTAGGLKNLIRFACSEFRLYGQKLPSGVPDMRSLAIYRNRSIDDYMRLIGPSLNPNKIGPLPKWAGSLFNRHSRGLARQQAKELATFIGALKSTMASEPRIFENGLISSMLMANLVTASPSAPCQRGQ